MTNAISIEELPLAPVEVGEEFIVVEMESGPQRFELRALPEKYIDWMEQGRRRVYDTILNGRSDTLTGPPHHLPMVTTYSPGSAFPFNCCNKGVGFQPKPEYLEEGIARLRDVHRRTRGKAWQESIRDRVEAVQWFYFNREIIDYRRLATLEIFEKNTYRNLRRNPIASLLYTGESPIFTSFQINAAVEIIGQDDPRHTFTMLVRTLFESEPFHIYQPQFPYAYIFWISEVISKTPFRVPVQPTKVQYETEKGDVRWDSDALEAVGHAPSMIQEYIRDLIESYARERGFQVITLALVEEAKKQFMPS